MLTRRAIPVLAFVIFLSGAACAQRNSVALSQAEEEEVRDAAALPAERVAVFQRIIDARVKRIQEVLADTRAQGRRDDIRQNMDEIAGLTDELEDNLGEYQDAHRDLRKPLPKLLDAIPRWQSVLRQAPDDPGYDLTRKLALDAIEDVRQQAADLVPEQAKYFKEHPPDKNANPGGVGEIIRR